MKLRQAKVTRRTMLGTVLTVAALSSGIPGRPAIANMPTQAKRRGYIDGPFGLVHYYDTGGEGRPLLMFHQSPQSARMFDPVYIPLTARGIRAIGVDSPGFGMSDVTSFAPTIEDWARIAPPLLDTLGIERADVLGYHTGAMLATEVALTVPDRVRNVIMHGPFPITEAEREARLKKMQLTEVDFEYKTDGSHLSDYFQYRLAMHGSGADPKLATLQVIERYQGFGPFWYGHNAAYRYDHAAALQRLRHRAMILTHTDDGIYGLAQRAREIRPDFAYVELEGGGNDILDKQPVAWSDAVARFLSNDHEVNS